MKGEKFKEKYGFDLREMQESQALNWLESVLKNSTLGTLEEAAYPEILKRLKTIIQESKIKLDKQEKVIDYALDKLNKKDVVAVTKILLSD